ncbi:hypothetical protein HN807_00380 [Candidatus Bathyarchaeota archaeon]|nr:hypothetical protein [Candidatus Bathyarchaeota archaeon]MBT3284612.1 hypothetical protein [Candidatus Bathyarchaeota archaeon]MBT4425068.1 hypothetical protein [Candidatus Bathyarchaeota archaeon]MBT7345522.1 hypothetical protein [Candidatus Bathyarchaeota archaeon]MBT7913067.1 hypothetical protein [Candidatus Bathyarchaeota archaeon]
MRKVASFILSLLLITSVTTVYAQEATPQYLELTVYDDGTVKAVYDVETDPTEVRVDVELFGSSFSNLVVRDDEDLPIEASVHGSTASIDSLGALELNIVYLTSSLTSKEGALWTLNFTSPASTRIILPAGSAIMDLGSLPFGIGTIDEKTYLDFDPGDLTVSYLLGLPEIDPEPDPDQIEAEATISEVADFIEDKIADISLPGPEAYLVEAEALYDQENYLDAKTKAEQALSLAVELVQIHDSAFSAIDNAEDAISDAQIDGRTVGLSEAVILLQTAQENFDVGSYVDAVATAGQAEQLALASSEPGGNGFLYFGVAVVLVVGVSGYLFMQKNKGTSQRPSFSTKVINLDKILAEHPNLRTEDKEVLRFLSENNGEVFASEIRDRFDMPRSSAWRLIRRLEGLEIIEETKVGNQSLVRIRSE